MPRKDTEDIPGSIGFNAEGNLIMVSPDQLVEDIAIRFEAYTRALRNPSNLQLRSNFEKRFDWDNKLEPYLDKN